MMTISPLFRVMWNIDSFCRNWNMWKKMVHYNKCRAIIRGLQAKDDLTNSVSSTEVGILGRRCYYVAVTVQMGILLATVIHEIWTYFSLDKNAVLCVVDCT